MEHIVAQIRPETAPVTEITYHDHAGMEHQKGTGCGCGAANHRKAYTQRPYNETEREAHEGGGAHTDHPDLPLVGPHRHTEEGKYMLNPNRERRAEPHTHRSFLPLGFTPDQRVVEILVSSQLLRTKKIALQFGVTEQHVDDTRNLARHIRRPLDHRFGGHAGDLSVGLDEEHLHEREVDYALEVVERSHPHRVYKVHSKTSADTVRRAGPRHSILTARSVSLTGTQ